ncbi:hypothetical protein BH18ACI2_BH18ACI2_27370 [soil metagenome]
MGRDKARLLLGGQTFVERIAQALTAIAPGRISLVSARPEDTQAGLPIVADLHRNCGALGGLHAALMHTRSAWAAIVSCDLPFVTGELFMRLTDLRNAGIDAVAPRQSDGRPQPLCAIYAREPCLAVAEEMICTGELRPRILLQQVNTRWAGPAEWGALKRSHLFFCNINEPEDYAQARMKAEAK